MAHNCENCKCSGGSYMTLSNYSSGGNRPGGWH